MSTAAAALSAPERVSLSRVEGELARLWEQDDASRSATRACMSNLMVFCASQREVSAVEPTLAELARRHPARVLVLHADPEAVTLDLEAWVAAYCSVGDKRRICSEQVVLRATGQTVQHLAAAARPLLIGDLPTALWWTPSDRAPFQHGELFDGLIAMADCVLYDSRGWRDPVRGVVATSSWAARSQGVVSDLAWRRLEPWRRLVARTLDPSLAPGALSGLQSVDVEHGPHALPKAWMFVGWLAQQLGWTPAQGERLSNERMGWTFSRTRNSGDEPEGVPIRVGVRRLSAGEPELYRVQVSWRAGGEDHRETLARLGPERLGVSSQGAGEDPRVVATLQRSRAALLADELSNRAERILFRETLGRARQMADVLDR